MIEIDKDTFSGTTHHTLHVPAPCEMSGCKAESIHDI